MTISLAAVFIPLVFMSGLMGRIFREFSHHDCDLDSRQRHRVAHAHAADDLAVAERSRRGRQKDMDGASVRRGRASRAGFLWPDSLVLPSPSLDIGR